MGRREAKFQVKRLAAPKRACVWREHVGLHDSRIAFRERMWDRFIGRNSFRSASSKAVECVTIPSRHIGSTCMYTRLCFENYIKPMLVHHGMLDQWVHIRLVLVGRCGTIFCTQSAYVHMMCSQPAGLEFQNGSYRAFGHFCCCC